MTDQFIREVDEEIREERTMRLVKAAAPAMIVAFLVVSGGVLANQFLKERRAAADRADYAAFEAALAADDDGALTAFAADATGGYGPLARLELARAAKATGETAEAVTLLDAVAVDERASVSLRRFAAVQAAALRVDDADYEEMQRRLAGVSLVRSSLGARAKELLAFSAWKAGRQAEARRLFDELTDQAEDDVRVAQRAAAMLELLDADPDAGIAGRGPDVDLSSIIDAAPDAGGEGEVSSDDAETPAPPTDETPAEDDVAEDDTAGADEPGGLGEDGR